MTALALDELDRQIVDHLSRDARTSNREIARALNVTEGTIRARLKRLLDGKIIRITAITNVNKLKQPLVALLWIEVESGSFIKQVAQDVAALPQIGYVATMLGRCDVMAVTLAEDGDQLIRYIHETIDSIPGVHQVRYTLVHQFVKHDYRWTMIVDGDNKNKRARGKAHR